MNFGSGKTNSIKGDVDSGLENVSDSGSSYVDDEFAIFSDYDESQNGEQEKMPTDDISNSSSNSSASDSIGEKITKRESIKSMEESKNLNSADYETGDTKRYYENLIKGQWETVDFSVNSKSGKPEWLDVEKFKRGQKFAREHLFCINFTEMLSLYILFAQKSSLEPLIFTGKSDTPFAAFNRYINTLSKLISWYTEDIWSEYENRGRMNLTIVRGMHENVYKNLNDLSKEEKAKKLTLGDPRTTALWCPLIDVLLADFRESIVLTSRQDDFRKRIREGVWLSQTDMSITQFSFVGLAVTFPESFGIHLASDEDLNGFIHMWKGLGFLLGIKEEYNFCNGDLKTVRDRTVFLLENMAKPSFRNVTCDWEHMSRCMTTGISFYVPAVNFESSFLYLCDVMKTNMPRFRKRMSFYNYVVYLFLKLTFYLMKYPGVLPWLNSRLYRFVERARTVPADVLNKWENRRFSYMSQPNKCPIRGQLMNRNH